MWPFWGTNSLVDLHLQTLVQADSTLQVQPQSGDELRLSVTDTYKHLGGIVSGTGSTSPELWNRIRSGHRPCAQTRSRWHALARASLLQLCFHVFVWVWATQVRTAGQCGP